MVSDNSDKIFSQDARSIYDEIHDVHKIRSSTNESISNEAENRKKRLLLLATGGTIASGQGKDGLEPEYTIDDILKITVTQADYYDLDARDILSLDSSNIQPEEWQIIARAIDENASMYDGIVVTHGTDTMAYTASIISFMLQGLKIPVVFTGSQIPITEALTDAHLNLASALAMAASSVPGVFLAFGGMIILGTRAVKTHTSRFRAFDSINREPFAVIDSVGINFNQNELNYLKERNSDRDYLARFDLCPEVFLLKLIPGMKPEILDYLIEAGYRGLVIEAFGIGGIHSLHRDLLKALERVLAKGIPVIVTSQCLYEKSDFSLYATGRKLLEAGAIEAFDMTTEAAVTKLIWCLGQGMDMFECRRVFNLDLVGEISRKI